LTIRFLNALDFFARAKSKRRHGEEAKRPMSSTNKRGKRVHVPLSRESADIRKKPAPELNLALLTPLFRLSLEEAILAG
jgi:hypothetical protein